MTDEMPHKYKVGDVVEWVVSSKLDSTAPVGE